MNDAKSRPTSIYVTKELRELVEAFQELSGLSMSNVFNMGALQLLAQHAHNLEFKAKKAHVRAQMLAEFLDLLGDVDREAVAAARSQKVTISMGGGVKPVIKT